MLKKVSKLLDAGFEDAGQAQGTYCVSAWPVGL